MTNNDTLAQSKLEAIASGKVTATYDVYLALDAKWIEAVQATKVAFDALQDSIHINGNNVEYQLFHEWIRLSATDKAIHTAKEIAWKANRDAIEERKLAKRLAND